MSVFNWFQSKFNKKNNIPSLDEKIAQLLHTATSLDSLKRLLESESISSYILLSYTKKENFLYTIIINDNISLTEKHNIFDFLFKASNMSFNDFIIKEYKSRYTLKKLGNFKSFLTQKYLIPSFESLFRPNDLISIPQPIFSDFEKYYDVLSLDSLDQIAIKIFGNKSKKNKRIILTEIFKTGRYFLISNILMIKTMFKDQQLYEETLSLILSNDISLDNLQLKFTYENYDQFTKSIIILKSMSDKSNYNFFIKDEKEKTKVKSYLIFDTLSMMEELNLSKIEYEPNSFKNIKHFHDDLATKINQLNEKLINLEYDHKTLSLHNKEIIHYPDRYRLELPHSNRNLQAIGNKLRNCAGSHHYTVKIQRKDALLLVVYKNNMMYGLIEYLIHNGEIGQAVIYANQPMNQNIYKTIQSSVNSHFNK